MNGVIYSLFISLAMRMTVITAFVMLVKAIFRRKLPAAAHCAIWIIPFVQTVFCIGGVSIPSKASIYNAVRDITVVNQAVAVQGSGHDVRNAVALIYIIGVLTAVMWYFSIFLIHMMRVSRSDTIEDAALKKILAAVKCDLDISDSIILKRGSYAHTLMKTIVLPEGYDHDEYRQILIHEMCHYKHRDNLKLWGAVFVISVNWFNPLIWLAFRQLRTDIEMYCDDSVLKLTDSRKAYARVLVKTASEHILFIPGASGVSNGKHEVAKRVERIAERKKKKPVWLAAAMIASVCVSCLCLTDAVTAVVQNTVEITATPEPVTAAAAIANAVTATAEPENIEAPANAAAPDSAPEAAQTSPVGGAAVNAQNNAEQTAVAAIGSNSSVPEREPAQEPVNAAGEQTGEEYTAPEPAEEEPAQTYEDADADADSAGANGSKESYTMDDGRTAVLHYDDGSLETGYIISGEE